MEVVRLDKHGMDIPIMMKFGEAIGHPHDPDNPNKKIIDTDNPAVRDIIDKINSEHGKTIVRVLIARNTNGSSDS